VFCFVASVSLWTSWYAYFIGRISPNLQLRCSCGKRCTD